MCAMPQCEGCRMQPGSLSDAAAVKPVSVFPSTRDLRILNPESCISWCGHQARSHDRCYHPHHDQIAFWRSSCANTSGSVILVILVAATASAMDIYVDFDRSGRFSWYKTYAWVETEETSLKGHNDLMHSRIKNAIEHYTLAGPADRVTTRTPISTSPITPVLERPSRSIPSALVSASAAVGA